MGGSKIRQPIKPNHNRAVHKGVPTNISGDKLLTEIGKLWKKLHLFIDSNQMGISLYIGKNNIWNRTTARAGN